MKQLLAFILLFILVFFLLTNTTSVGEEKVCKNVGEKSMLDSMCSNLKSYNISRNCIDLAIQGYNKLLKENKLKNRKYLTIVDMSLSSNKERFFIIDTDKYKVIHSSLVAHGKNSGNEFATNFSNIPESKQTSLGLYVTGEIYTGGHGLSMRLDGCSSYNSNARERNIVIHSADYVSYRFIRENNRLGRSWGCPALPYNDYDYVVNTIKEGSCLFIYHPKLSSLSALYASI